MPSHARKFAIPLERVLRAPSTSTAQRSSVSARLLPTRSSRSANATTSPTYVPQRPLQEWPHHLLRLGQRNARMATRTWRTLHQNLRILFHHSTFPSCLSHLRPRTCSSAASSFSDLREANATFATLTLVLSPLFIPLSFSFMSDIPGMFAIVVCLYLCLRAVDTPLPSQTSAWLMAASVSSALLGTVRQTSWLGLFVMVPSVWWLVRKRRPPVTALAVVWFLSANFVFSCMYWFSKQMYSTVETLSQVRTDQDHFIMRGGAGNLHSLGSHFFPRSHSDCLCLPFREEKQTPPIPVARGKR